MAKISFNGGEVEIDVVKLPARLEKAIRQKHDHEGPNNPPLWLIWLDRPSWKEGPLLNAVANSVDAARYGCFIVLDQGEVWCERVPANHGFASSIQGKNSEKFWKGVSAYVKTHGYKREGD